MSDLSISMIVAHDCNFAIGDSTDSSKNHCLPWTSRQAKGDLKRFKKLTMDSVCIVGRKTKLPPLKGRTVMRLSNSNEKDCFTAEQAFAEIRRSFLPTVPVFVIGGKQIYKHFLENNLVETVYVSFINSTNAVADVFLEPDFLRHFELISEEPLMQGDESSGNLFCVYKRNRNL
jgi:dihydrofolate reductase